MKTVVYNNADLNGVVVDLTEEQVNHLNAVKTEIENQKNAEAEELAQKKTDAQSGNQKLLDLGLTQAEATALTGYKPE
tara:strand:- start:440 stop:673 length:234 start_codon:yes stop_codon:yes gene_type:complete